jgi:hypothetical protein
MTVQPVKSADRKIRLGEHLYGSDLQERLTNGPAGMHHDDPRENCCIRCTR